jgi:hypothetical protein
LLSTELVSKYVGEKSHKDSTFPTDPALDKLDFMHEEDFLHNVKAFGKMGDERLYSLILLISAMRTLFVFVVYPCSSDFFDCLRTPVVALHGREHSR